VVTETGPFVLLDIGANMDSSGNNLYQFAHMGSIYAERVLGRPKPRVALLSIGEERGKATWQFSWPRRCSTTMAA